MNSKLSIAFPRSFFPFLFILSVSFITACSPNENDGGKDWAQVSLSLAKTGTAYKIASEKSATGTSATTSLIAAVPINITSVASLDDIISSYSRNLLGADSTVTLNVPLDTPLHIVQLVFDGDYTLVELTTASPIPATSGVSDLISFTGGISAVTVPVILAPTVVSISPLSGETGVAFTPAFSVTFDQVMDDNSFAPNTIDTTCSGSVQLSSDGFTTCVRFSTASLAMSADGMTFSGSPASRLDNSTTYQLKITSDVTSESGQTMLNDYTTGFTTYNFYENNIPSASGTLDTTFGSGGKLVWHINSSDRVEDITLAADGNILILASPGSQDPRVYKVDSSGTLDSTFGGGSGYYQMSTGSTNPGAESIALGDDQSIYILGRIGAGATDMQIWSYTAAGTTNTSFNSSGYLTEASVSIGDTITRYTDGDFLMTGSGSAVFTLIKMSPDGTYDTDFGSGGFADFDNPTSYDTAIDILIDDRERILVCGNGGGYAQQDLAIWRLSADGTLDTSFGVDGIVSHSNAAGSPSDDQVDTCQGMAFDENGDIVLAGYSGNGTDFDLVVWKYLSDGTPDTNFGNNGFYLYSGAGHYHGYDIAMDGSGKILVVGDKSNGTDQDLLILRLNADGSLDSTFGSSGIITVHDIASGTGTLTDTGYTIELMENGDFLVGGQTRGASDYDGFVMKYN